MLWVHGCDYLGVHAGKARVVGTEDKMNSKEKRYRRIEIQPEMRREEGQGT